MDDMWDTKIWDAIKRILPDDSNGSRIILTSRLLDVATYAGSLGFLLHMQFLNEDQSWSLFCEKVVCPHELEDIGRLIAKNCRGLPLAIVVVAGLLSKANTTRYDWEEIARGVSSTAAENDEHFSKILSLSYNHLPHHLKPCFLYFGGFPEDYKIPISKLIKLWVAEGFLKQIEDKTFEVAEEYLEDLVNRNLLLVTKWRSNGKFRCCSIHDLLRDLCSERARNENFLHFPRNNDDFHQDAIANVYRLYIHQDSSFPKFQVKDYVSYVRSILFFRDTWDRFSSDASDFKLLRVLDAPNVMFDFFPTQILKLLYLRYLALLTRKFRIPSLIVKLQNLQTLIISSVPRLSPSPVLLPFEIWKMPQLRHIMIDEARLPNIHHGSYTRGVPFLESLQTLWNVANCTFTHGTVEMIPNLKKLKVVYSKQKTWTKFGLNNLVHLQGLEILDIRFTLYGFHEYVEVPLPERFVFPLKLKKLSLKGCMLPWKDMTVVGLLPNLQVLKLRWASFVGEDWVPTEGQFLKLKYLLMEELYDLKYWEAENTHFPCLEQLQINNCKALEEIPSGIGDTPTLQLIEVFNSDSALESSAERILEEQRELGNDVLKFHIYRWDSNSSMGDESSEDDEALQETSSEH